MQRSLNSLLLERVSRIVALACLFALPALATEAGLSEGQGIKVMLSGGFAAAYHQLAPRFEASTKTRLETVTGPSMGIAPSAIPVRLSRGEDADVVIMARPALDRLVNQGFVLPGSEVDLGRSRIGMAVRAGSTVPNIRSVKAFRRALLEAKSIGYSDSASGVYISTQLFRRLGIEKEMAGKGRQIQAEPVGEVVARGELEIGFQQISELKPITGITIVGPIPEEVQQVTVFSAGLVEKSQHQAEARELIDFLASSAACPAIEESELEPVSCPRRTARKNAQHHSANQ